MRVCYVCGVPLDAPAAYGSKASATSYAARALPGVGVVEVCGEACRDDPKFSGVSAMKVTIEATADELDALIDQIASRIATKLQPSLTGATQAMSAELDALTAQVHSNTSVVQSAVTLINGISARITAAGTDPAALAALTTELDSQDQALAAAVAANTPATPPADTTTGGGTVA